MVDISRKKYERIGLETALDSSGIVWLNERHIEDGLDQKYL